MSKSVTSKDVREAVKKIVKNQQKEDQIISLFWDLDAFNSFLEVDGVLDVLVAYLNGHKDFSRHDFYSHYISKLEEVDDVILDVYRQLALSMELLQVNDLNKDDLQKVLKQLKYTHKFDVEAFLDSQIFGVSKEAKVSFNHHTTQEFLAVQYIESHKDPLTTFRKHALIETDEIQAIKPSWFNVIRLLLEGNNGESILQSILDISEKDPGNVNEQFADAMSSFNPKQITDDQKKRLFFLIYDIYLEKAIWLPTWASKNIWQIAPKEAVSTIKELFENGVSNVKEAVNVGNAIPIVSGIIQHFPGYIQDQGYWKDKFIDFAKVSKGYGVVQRRAFDALENYQGEKILEQVKDVMDSSKDKLVRDALIDSAYTIAPNSKINVDLIIKGYQKGNSINARYGIYAITERETFDYFLEQLLEHDAFRSKFLDDSSLFTSGGDRDEMKLIQKMEKFSKNDETLNLLKQVLKVSYQHESRYDDLRRTVFLPETARIIAERDSEYIFQLIEEITEENTEDPLKGIWDFEQILPYFFTTENAEKLATKIKDVDPERTYSLQRIIYGLKSEKIKKGEEIFQILVEKGFIKPVEGKQEEEEPKEDNILKNFIEGLFPKGKTKKFRLDVFQTYAKNQDHLDKVLNPEGKEIKRLKDLVINTVLEKWDPKKFEVTVTRKNEKGGTGQYTITNTAPVYGDALQVAEKLVSQKILDKYRENILLFIPFAYHEERQSAINILGKVKDSELSSLNTIYLDKTTDKRYFLPSSYVYFIKSLLEKSCKLPSAKEVLLSFIDDEEIESYVKLEAIEVLEDFISAKKKKDKEILEAIFNNLHKDENDYKRKTGEYANQILINKFKDRGAIIWRLNTIKNRATDVVIPEGFHTISDIEDELHSMKFALPIIELRNKKYIPQIIDLLDFSFSIQEEKGYTNYANYIWRIVTEFLFRIKGNKSFKPYLTLQEHLNESPGSNWFNSRLDELRAAYIDEYSKADALNVLSFLQKT